jgi:hypothetical protein
MKSAPFRRLEWCGSGVLAVLLFQGVFTPAVAWAGCDHGVIPQAGRSLKINRLDALIVGGSGSAARLSSVPADAPLAPRSSQRRTPCSGMSCSRPVPLPVSTISLGPRTIDQWGTLVGPLVLALPPFFDEGMEPPALHPGGYKPSIFHPPPL